MPETLGLSRLAPAGNPVETALSLAQAFARTAALHDRTAELPVANFQALRQAGLMGLTAPGPLGGRGAGLAEAAAVIGAIAGGEPSTALILFMHYTNLAAIPRGRWDPALVEEVVGSGATQGALINSLRVEPELGSPARGGLPLTTARATGSGWEISGHKIYSTGSTALGWMLVWAKTDEAVPRVGRFVVPAGSPGTHIKQSWNALGMRATASHDVIFDKVAVPARYAADLRTPDQWKGKEPIEAAWHGALLAAVYDAIARSARDWLVTFLNERKPASLGAPLATLPRFQEAVGEIEKRLLVNRSLIERTGRDVDNGLVPPAEDSALLKVIVTENAIAVVEQCVKLSSNHGINRDNPLERHFRDVLCGRIHTPQDDSALAASGRRALSRWSAEP